MPSSSLLGVWEIKPRAAEWPDKLWRDEHSVGCWPPRPVFGFLDADDGWSTSHPGVCHYHALVIYITALGNIIPLAGNFPCLICIQRGRKDKNQRENVPCFVARWEDGCVCVCLICNERKQMEFVFLIDNRRTSGNYRMKPSICYILHGEIWAYKVWENGALALFMLLRSTAPTLPEDLTNMTGSLVLQIGVAKRLLTGFL